MQLSNRAKSIAPFLAMQFAEHAAELEQQGHHIIRLNIGEPDFGAPEPVKQALQTILADQSLPYTSALGMPELRQAIADFYQRMHGVQVDYNRIVVTAGASAALLLVAAALVNNGDGVLVSDPSYPCNRQFISCFDGDVQLVETPASAHFNFTYESVVTHWQTNSKGIMVASPANPTGTMVANQELKKICEFVEAQGGFRIIDEIYLNLSHADINNMPQTALSFDNDAIIINSFSKYFSMTGWRLGWCVVPESMIPAIERLAQNLYICPSTLSQKAALACFSEETLAICEQRRQTLIQRKALVLQGLQEIGLPVDVEPDGAFYVYINVSNTGLDAMTFCQRALNEAHVALTPGNDFGFAEGSHYVRLSFATSDANLRAGLERLARFVAALN